MYCAKCGQEIDSNAAFCPHCGEKTENVSAEKNTNVEIENMNENPVGIPDAPTAVPETPAAETPAAPTAAPEVSSAGTYDASAPTGAYAAPEQGYYQSASEPATPAAPKKKMKLWLKLLLFIGVPIVVIAALIAINFNALKGLFVKNFMSADAYIATVEGESLKEYYETFTNIYANGVDTVVGSTSDSSAAAEINFSLSDSFATTLSDSAYTDLSWLSDITLKADSSSYGGVTATDVDIMFGDSKILSLTQTIDTASGKTYLSFPELSSQVIAVDGAAVDNEYSVSDIIEFVSKLPEAERLNALFAKYVEIVLKNIEGTQMAEGSITAGGIEQQCTELRLEFNKALLQKIFTAVIEEMKNDSELKGIFISLKDNYNELLGIDYTGGEEAYDNFLSALDDLLDNVNSVDESELGDVVFTLTDYVDSHNKIIGRRIDTAEDGRTYFMGKASANGKIGLELDLDGEIVLKGSGIEKGSLISGDYVLSAQGSEVLNFSLASFDTESLKDGKINGDITFELGRTADYGYDSGSAFSAMFRQFTYKLSARMDDNSYSLSLSALSGDEDAIALSASVGTKKGSVKTVVPDADVECTLGENDAVDTIDAWVDGMDFASLEKKLEEAGVPAQLAPSARYLLGSFVYSITGAQESYYEDDDDWYYDDDDDLYDDWSDDDWNDYDWDEDDYYWGDDDWYDDGSDSIGTGGTDI